MLGRLSSSWWLSSSAASRVPADIAIVQGTAKGGLIRTSATKLTGSASASANQKWITGLCLQDRFRHDGWLARSSCRLKGVWPGSSIDQPGWLRSRSSTKSVEAGTWLGRAQLRKELIPLRFYVEQQHQNTQQSSTQQQASLGEEFLRPYCWLAEILTRPTRLDYAKVLKVHGLRFFLAKLI